MPEFSAKPPVTELYDPVNVVGITVDGISHEVVKGTFKEEVVEIPGPYETSRPERRQMFECHTNMWFEPGETKSHTVGYKEVRMIGPSANITSLMIDDL